MININWQVRFKNPLFWVQLFVAAASFIGVYFSLKPEDINSWSVLFDTLLKIVSNPYVLFNLFVVFINSVIDFTTKGASDSTQALNYTKPRQNIK